MEWCFYVELDDPPQPRPSAANERPATTTSSSALVGTARPSMLAIDSEGSGHADLLVWSRDRVELLKHGAEAIKNSGLEALKDVRSMAVGDYDNDGLNDLCIMTGAAPRSFTTTKARFAKAVDLPNTAGATTALWLDFDHDYDLDLLLFGPNSVLMRNIKNGKFEDKTSGFSICERPGSRCGRDRVRIDTAARDVVVSYADRRRCPVSRPFERRFRSQRSECAG